MLYEWAPCDAARRLLDVRGIFTTLTHVLVDVTDNAAKT